MTQNRTLAWMKALLPYILLLLSVATVWGGMSVKIENEIERRHDTDSAVEYIRRQNVQILREIAEVKTHLEYLRNNGCR